MTENFFIIISTGDAETATRVVNAADEDGDCTVVVFEDKAVTRHATDAPPAGGWRPRS